MCWVGKDHAVRLQDYVSALATLLPGNPGSQLSPSAAQDVQRLAHEAVSCFTKHLQALADSNSKTMTFQPTAAGCSIPC